MSNKRYEEDQDAGLPQRVKGPKGSPASFGGLGADKDDEKADLNSTGVRMPQESTKKLPKAGEAV